MTGPVAGIEAFGDQAFPAQIEGALQEGAAVGENELAEAEQRRPGAAEHALEARAPRRERQAPQIVRAVAEDVEGDERDGHGSARSSNLLGSCQVDATLEPLESSRLPGLVERHQFPVQHEASADAPAELPERPDDLRELRRLVVAEPGVQADRTVAA